ncbi:MAG TPA: ABC transporter permease [Thermoanaerobaculia bacterium]|jgi:predicted permease|nr:ABC transporter permease [Thermoanaerobaculia bacterium]
MERLWQDLRYSLRALRRSPAFTAAAVASLALGIGANTLIFTFLNSLFLKSLPVAAPDRLVALYAKDLEKQDLVSLSYPDFLDLRREAGGVFSGLAAYRNVSLVLSGSGDPAQLPGVVVSAGYFDVLGVRPARGRFFLPDEDGTSGAHPVVVLSHALWQSRFGSDPGIVGRTVRLNNQGLTVVGIAPSEFKGLSILDRPPEVWVPAAMHRDLLKGPQALWIDKRGTFVFSGVARLAPGAGIERAGALLATFGRRLEKDFPADHQGLGLVAVPLAQAALPPGQRGGLVLSAGVLAAVVGLLLLIAGANVANLLLARALARSGEVAVRLALGAGRGRLVRQLLTEGVLLGLLGGAAGLLIALWGRKVLWALKPPFFPDSLDLGIDARVLGFTFAIAIATGVLFSLAPVFQSFRLDLAATLTRQTRSGGARGDGSGSVLRELLIAGQVALSVVVLAGAGLFLRSMLAVERIDPGFETEKLFVVPMDAGGQGYTPPRAQDLYRQAVERVGNLPGVRSAAVASRFLLVGGGTRQSVTAEGQETAPGSRDLLAGVNVVGPGYFQTVGMPIRAGRAFDPTDRAGSLPVVVINETLARLLWPGGPALGKRLRLGDDEGLFEVVGVAADARYAGLREPPPPYAYRPVLQSYSPMMMLHVRTAGDPTPLLQKVRREVQLLAPGLPLLEPRTITQVRNQSLWAPRMGAGLLSVFGLLALVLAALGIYGVVAYSVGQREREIGIRMALGAERRDVLGLVVRQSLRPVVLGVVLGVVAALVAARTIASLLFGVGAADPLALAGAAALLVLVALAAIFAPARRASGLDPVTALRQG